MQYANSSDWQLNTYHYELRHLHESFETLAFTWRSFIIHIEELRTSSSFKLRNCLNQVPEFTSGIPSIEISANAQNSNATAVLNFLIQKGGVFIMLPLQERVKEVPNE